MWHPCHSPLLQPPVTLHGLLKQRCKDTNYFGITGQSSENKYKSTLFATKSYNKHLSDNVDTHNYFNTF